MWEEVVGVLHPNKRKEVKVKIEKPPIEWWSLIDYVPYTVPPSTGNARLVVFEDNGAILKGRIPKMRHVSGHIELISIGSLRDAGWILL